MIDEASAFAEIQRPAAQTIFLSREESIVEGAAAGELPGAPVSKPEQSISPAAPIAIPPTIAPNQSLLNPKLYFPR